MRCGSYELVKAPDDYPGKKYSGFRCYEHRLVWWQETGEILQVNEIIHHINGNGRDNRFENLEKLSRAEHSILHGKTGKSMVEMLCPMCHSKFTKERRATHLIQKSKSTFCSRGCAGKSAYFKVDKTTILREYKA